MFKVGDFVTTRNDFGDISKPFKLRSEDYKGIQAKNQAWFDSLELWQPKEGEYVILYNFSDGLAQSFRVAKFKHIAHGKGREGQYKDMQGNYFTHCEPFIGELPSFIKDK